jgi:hypothetical protein
MSDLRHKLVGGAVGAAIAMLAVAAFLLLTREKPYDPKFDTKIVTPTYLAEGPVVLFDEGHRHSHTTRGGYKPLAELIRNDGYDLRVVHGPFSEQVLQGAGILLIALARGASDTNDDAAFTDSEVDAVGRWVRGGGSLLLITDHWPYGPAAASLAQRFGVEMGKGLVEDPVHHDPIRGKSHLIFSEENGLLRDHPIVRGRNSMEQIHRVLTFTGQSLLGPPVATSFLALSDSAVEMPPTKPRADKAGSDVRVQMEYGAPVSAAGRAQGIAMELEKGRIVILGEAGALRAERPRKGDRVGMNVPGYDNRQLALNIMHWLSREL